MAETDGEDHPFRHLTDAEAGAVLAGLALLAEASSLSGPVAALATSNGAHPALTSAQVRDLADRLSCDPFDNEGVL
ncbi:hypothetical protein JP75_07745 [Devosia riboflavina]|uniref:Uncharacterized protein n=1 Tax=Devosia riboflavina TaxID=46914 RepID=A0A087M3I5_9HYPH|nr:hypothetical protein [Devosia riboflavina]KFL31438.1 hypothetical protein JP75_07745 [Devosia riboflavina]